MTRPAEPAGGFVRAVDITVPPEPRRAFPLNLPAVRDVRSLPLDPSRPVRSMAVMGEKVSADALNDVQRSSPKIAPQGSRLAYLRSDDGGGTSLWVRSLDGLTDQQLTDARPRIGDYFWSPDERWLLYLQDEGGDENWRLFAADASTGAVRCLTPLHGVQVQVVGTSPFRPAHVLLAINREDRTRHDAYLLDLDSGALTMVARNEGFARWLSDGELGARAAVRPLADGGMQVVVRDRSGWRPVFEAAPDDVASGDVLIGPYTSHMSLSLDGRLLFLCSASGARTRRLLEVDTASGAVRVVAEHERYDVGGTRVPPGRLSAPYLADPGTGRPQVATFTGERLEYRVLDPALAADVERLRATHPGDHFVLSRDAADRFWTVGYERDVEPVAYYLYDRAKGEASFLFRRTDRLAGFELAEMEPFHFVARDGREIHGYLSFPPGRGRTGLPAVLNVHGGPWIRDHWGFEPTTQFFATRGYLCIQVNYRGSSGYGKEHMNAGDREWGGRMHDDLVDAVRWCSARGYVDPDRVAIYGGSYGGYAALVGAAFTPEVFRCAIAGVAPVDLATTIDSLPPYWSTARTLFLRRVGDPVRDRELLWSRSPISRAGQIPIPVLIAHGANDARVPSGQASALVDEMRAGGAEPELILFEDGGHHFLGLREHRSVFYDAVEGFLARHMA
jgi:dipeptidyl aminopeptidase/acylaminoacyl peptidase